MQTNKFSINQIVKGHVAGTFVILGFREIGGETYAQLKVVNPANYAETSPGELALPLTALREAVESVDSWSGRLGVIGMAELASGGE